MKPSLRRKPPARAIASRSGTAQWCSSRISAAAESLGMSSRMSHASSSENTLTPSAAGLGARLGAGDHPFLALDPEADQRADLAAELDRLVLGEVAQVRDLDLSVGVLVHGERVDDAHRVALLQALELGDDLAVELGVAEAEHDELNGPDGHGCSFSLREAGHFHARPAPRSGHHPMRMISVDEIEALGAVGDQQHRAIAGGGEDVVDERAGGGRIEVGGRLVEHQHGRVGQQRAGEHDPLALAARELAALLADERVQPVRQRRDPRPRSGRGAAPARRRASLASGPREADVLADARREQVRVLAGDRDRAADVRLAVLAQVAPRERHPPASGSRKRSSRLTTVVLPGAAGADERDAARPARGAG